MPDAKSATREDTAAATDTERALRARAVRLLAGREHTREELRRKLTTGAAEAPAVDRVVAALSAANLVSDARFVEEFVRARIARGHGPIRIRADLRSRGIDDERIDEVLTRSAAFWLEQMTQVRTKKFGNDLPTGRAAWGRQARFLAQRGFPADVIYQGLHAEPD